MVGEGVADNALGTKILDRCKIEPALAGRNVGDVADPCLIWPIRVKIALKQVGRNRVRMVGICGHPISFLAL